MSHRESVCWFSVCMSHKASFAVRTSDKVVPKLCCHIYLSYRTLYKMEGKIEFSTGDSIIHSNDVKEQLLIEDPRDYFDIDKCVEFIKQGNHQNVCLQFPDELLSYSNSVSVMIEKICGFKCAILADTSYGSCCVDEVAAQHFEADAIIHFGHSCLSQAESNSVLYIFGKSSFDATDFIMKIKKTFSDEYLLVFYDVCYYVAIQEEKQRLIQNCPKLVLSEIKLQTNVKADDDSNICETCFGRSYSLTKNLSEYKIVYIGGESLALNNFILKFNRIAIFSYDPTTKTMVRQGVNVNKLLMKRFYLIEKAKDASIVGIIIGTLGIARHKEMLTRMQKVLKTAGKKFYTFLVGKINVPKLANYAEIDIFVLIACPENSLINSSEFYKPIVTPFEMEIACLRGREWTGEYITEFEMLLPGCSNHVDVEDEEESTEPEYSLITGQLRNKLSLKDDEHRNSTDVVLSNQENQLMAEKPLNAAQFLSSRTWQGLQVETEDTKIEKISEGRSGIAMQYSNELTESTE